MIIAKFIKQIYISEDLKVDNLNRRKSFIEFNFEGGNK